MIHMASYGVFFLVFATIASSHSDGDIRLAGGTYPWEGRVEIYFSGTWGTIIDSDWTNRYAQVFCRMLGYLEPGASTKTGAFFGPGNGPIYKVLHVNCSDTEYNFSNCVTYEREDEHNSHSEDVGVKCQTNNCADGEVRLMEGEIVNEREGRLEICFGQRWGTVGSDGWNQTNAEIVCQGLGYTDSGANFSSAKILANSSSLHMNNVHCSGTEVTLIDCGYKKTYNNTDHYNVVVVKCNGSCVDGNLTLFANESKSEGLLGVCFSQRWGTVNGNGWASSDTQVACRQLGFGGDFTSYKKKGILSLPIFMDNVGCYGTEHKLMHCSHRNDTSENNHINDIWIKCDITVSVSLSETLTTIISMVALVVSILSILVIIFLFLTGYVLYRHKNKPHTSDSFGYDSDEFESETAGAETNEAIPEQRVEAETNDSETVPEQTVAEQIDTSSTPIGIPKPKAPYAEIDTRKLDSPTEYEKLSKKRKKKKSSQVQSEVEYENMHRLEVNDWELHSLHSMHSMHSLAGQVSLHEQAHEEL